MNVAVLMPSRIGEFVLALSVLSRKEPAGEGSITLIVPQHLIPLCTLLSPLPYFPYRRSGRGELLDSIAGVKRQAFSRLYIMVNSLSTGWFGLRTGIPVRRGMSGELLNPFLTQAVTPPSSKRNEVHLTREYADILEVAAGEPDAWPGISIPGAADCRNVVVLCPGSNHGPVKQWQGFRDIVKLLPDHEFVILGDRKDGSSAKAIASHFPHRVRNRAGQTTIESAASILASASVVISNHSGLMHLAGFLGTPVVGIFGSTSPKRHRPLGREVRCVTSETVCPPCDKNSCSRRDHLCFKSITAQRVIEAAGEIVRSTAE